MDTGPQKTEQYVLFIALHLLYLVQQLQQILLHHVSIIIIYIAIYMVAILLIITFRANIIVLTCNCGI